MGGSVNWDKKNQQKHKVVKAGNRLEIVRNK